MADVDLAEQLLLKPPQRISFQVENKHRKFQPEDKKLAQYYMCEEGPGMKATDRNRCWWADSHNTAGPDYLQLKEQKGPEVFLLENTTSLSFLFSSRLLFASLNQDFDVILDFYFPYFLTFPVSINFYSVTPPSQTKLQPSPMGIAIHHLFSCLIWYITWEVLQFSGEKGDCGLFFIYMNPQWSKCPSFLWVHMETVILSLEGLLDRTMG